MTVLTLTFLSSGWILTSVPVVLAESNKNLNCNEPATSVVQQADLLYEEHSYKKLRDLLAQYKVSF